MSLGGSVLLGLLAVTCGGSTETDGAGGGRNTGGESNSSAGGSGDAGANQGGGGGDPGCAVDKDCDDGDACTIDSCPNSTCEHQAAVIDDDDECTIDGCDKVMGVVHMPVSVDDSDACTADACDPASGTVTHTPVTVNDNNTCTTDACDPMSGVTHVPVDTSDGNTCTVDMCDPMTGVSHVPIDPNDGNACTIDTCDPMTGIVHAPVNPDDSDACTDDSCDPMTGVIHTPVNLSDNDACTTDACDPATGVTHTPMQCNDNNACTADSCNPASGCDFMPIVACKAAADGCCPAGCTTLNDADCLFFPSGVQQNVPPAALVGWTVCYQDTYNVNMQAQIPNILQSCSKNKILMACKQQAAPNFQLAAAGLRVDVFFDTNQQSVTHNANGVGWYFNASHSWGFVTAGQSVALGQCDIPVGTDRLCWHTINAAGGYRCGNNTGLNSAADWQRFVYHAD